MMDSSYWTLKMNVRHVRYILWEHLPYFCILAIYIVIGATILSGMGRNAFDNLQERYVLFFNRMGLLAIAYSIIQACHLLAGLLAKLIENITGSTRRYSSANSEIDFFVQVLGFIIIFATFPLFLTMFTNLKQIIPTINPFSWDQKFMMIDFIIHGGHHPWELIQLFLGYPFVTNAIDLIYLSWFYILFFIVGWMGFSRRRKLRAKFFLSIMITWILLGTILGIIFSSAGPCYYKNITGDGSIYHPLMDYLKRTHEQKFLFAFKFQGDLWESYKNNYVGIFSGISAMPSIHVATTVIFSLVGWKIRPLLGFAFIFDALIIQVGSIHLGWRGCQAPRAQLQVLL